MSAGFIPLGWDIQVKGAEGVKSELARINQEFKNGNLSATEYAAALRGVNRDARALTQINTTQRNMFLAMHPAVNQLSRSMSVLASASRTALSITNALNLATIAFNTSSIALVELQAEIAQKERELAMAHKKFGENSIEVANIQEELNVLYARQAEETKRIADQQFQNAISLGAAVLLAASSAVQIATKVIPHLGALRGALFALAPAVWAAFGPYALIAGAIIALGFAIVWLITHWDQLLIAWKLVELVALAPMYEWFTVTLPAAFKTFVASLLVALQFIREGFLNIFNGIIRIVNQAINLIIDGIQSIVNGVIRAINLMISAYNTAAGVLGRPRIRPIGLVSLPRVSLPAIAAAEGFAGTVTRPTLFLAGEAGPENVNISPLGRPAAGGKGNLTVIVQGLITEHQLLDLFDDYLKGRLKQHGFGT